MINKTLFNREIIMKNEKVQQNIYEMTASFFGDIDATYDPDADKLPQAIFRHQDLEISDYFMSLRNALVQDFLCEFNSLEEAIDTRGRNVMQKKDDRSAYSFDTPDPNGTRFPGPVTQIVRKAVSDTESVENPTGWRNVELKYHDPYNNVHWDIDNDYLKTKYPTAWNLLQEFGNDCPICSYSYLAPKTSIYRHTGPENRDGEYIRIHIPLIIPAGDLFFEVNGEEVTWDNIFAFDNQFAHSAHNLSDGHRLIFLIDIKRSRLALPAGEKWSKNRQLYAMSKPFVRKSN